MTGKANIEVRPRFVNKGEIAKRLVQEYGDGPGEALEFVLCLGDDFTDEGKDSMFLFFICLLTIARHVPRLAAVKATRGPRLLGDCGCELQTNACQLAFS